MRKDRKDYPRLADTGFVFPKMRRRTKPTLPYWICQEPAGPKMNHHRHMVVLGGGFGFAVGSRKA